MKNVVLALLAACILFPLCALADDPYYIDLGNAVSDDEAAQTWQALSDKNKDVLGKLHLYPADILQEDHSVVTRIQAGPIASKRQALHTCSKLFKRETPCFVIEGLEHPETLEAHRSASSVFAGLPLPWHDTPEAVAPATVTAEAAPAEAAKPATKSDHTFMPWIFGHDKKPAPAPVPALTPPAPAVADADTATGSVEVAEAIHVPLSSGEAPPQPIVTKALKPLTAADIQPENATPVQASVEQSGWLNVEAFGSEDQAAQFWQSVRGSIPKLAAGLRVRILKPLAAQDEAAVSLNVGPFPSRDDAMAFCRNGIKVANDALVCRFDKIELNPATATADRGEHGDAYAARRAALSAHHQVPAQENAPSNATTPITKQFWLQVATAPNQMDAIAMWEKLRTDNADLLDGMRSSVSASLMGKGGYVVRIGPVGTYPDAAELCKNLIARGVSCRVYSNM